MNEQPGADISARYFRFAADEAHGRWVLPDTSIEGGAPGRFQMAVNGIKPAWTDPLGAAIEWIPAMN